MTDGGQAAPGWYPDPYQPARLRYWDGEVWTENYHEGDGKLPGIGDWLNSTFKAIGAYGIPALILAIGASLVLSLITFGGLYWIVGDASIVGEEFIGDVAPIVIRAVIVFLVIVLAQGFVWLAINRFMQRAHLQAEPSIAEALSRAVTRLPRLIGVSLLLIGGAVIVVLILAVIIVVLGEAAAGAAVLLVLLMIPLAVFLSVKLSFISAAVVASPTSESVIRSSASVSKGRFWPVLGRVLLLSIGVGIVSSMISGALGGLGQPVDQEVIIDVFVQNGDTFIVRDFAFRDLLPGAGSFFVYVIVSSIINGLTGLVTTSGFMRLYLDSGAPSEL
jgi:hypothetical protein